MEINNHMHLRQYAVTLPILHSPVAFQDALLHVSSSWTVLIPLHFLYWHISEAQRSFFVVRNPVLF